MKNNKTILMMILVLIMALVLAACTNEANTAETQEEQMTEEPMEEADDMEEMTEDEEMADEEPEEEMEAESDELMLTVDELKMYDGTNGNPAYVAYDGVIYDVTNDSNWASGSHGGNMVGTDITENLDSAPHGTSKLSQLEAVGKIIE